MHCLNVICYPIFGRWRQYPSCKLKNRDSYKQQRWQGEGYHLTDLQHHQKLASACKSFPLKSMRTHCQLSHNIMELPLSVDAHIVSLFFCALIPRDGISSWVGPVQLQVPSFQVLTEMALATEGFSVLLVESRTTKESRQYLLYIQKKVLLHSQGRA